MDSSPSHHISRRSPLPAPAPRRGLGVPPAPKLHPPRAGSRRTGRARGNSPLLTFWRGTIRPGELWRPQRPWEGQRGQAVMVLSVPRAVTSGWHRSLPVGPPRPQGRLRGRAGPRGAGGARLVSVTPGSPGQPATPAQPRHQCRAPTAGPAEAERGPPCRGRVPSCRHLRPRPRGALFPLSRQRRLRGPDNAGAARGGAPHWPCRPHRLRPRDGAPPASPAPARTGFSLRKLWIIVEMSKK